MQVLIFISIFILIFICIFLTLNSFSAEVRSAIFAFTLTVTLTLFDLISLTVTSFLCDFLCHLPIAVTLMVATCLVVSFV